MSVRELARGRDTARKSFSSREKQRRKKKMGRQNAIEARPFRSSVTQWWSLVMEKVGEWWRRLHDGRLVLVVTRDDGEG
ncbi:hypothetical protein Fmac_018337 [Flemingia macrophylla]|uniref:Uncharacterized protein n=1 Tax=Flemingia macrophylla TaxID=520843 RepID=A0ABD1M4S3_9FABA